MRKRSMLHLDQKQASYKGHTAHSGDYDGEVVEREAEVIKSVMAQLLSEKAAFVEPQPQEKKGFWGFFKR